MAELDVLLQRICDAHVDFVIVGGFACALYGTEPSTPSLDLCTDLSAPHRSTLFDALQPLRPIHRTTPGRPALTDHPQLGTLTRLHLLTDLGTLNVWSSVAGVGDYVRVHSASTSMTIAGRSCRVIGLRDLISSKRVLGRQEDRNAVEKLTQIDSDRARQKTS
jgi:hypothetical protein